MRHSDQPLYPEELSQFLVARAAQLDAQPVAAKASPYHAIQQARMLEGVTPMSTEFQLLHPRRVRSSGWHQQPDGHMAHFIGYRILTPDDEAWFRLNDPENGLHNEDVRAFRSSIRGPVKCGPLSRFFARLKFWTSKGKDEYVIPHFFRHHSD